MKKWPKFFHFAASDFIDRPGLGYMQCARYTGGHVYL